MADVTVPMDDKELFASAMSDAPETPEAPVERAEEAGQPRDDHGRFAPKTEQPVQAEAVQQTPPPQAEKQETDALVPSWRVREIREEERQRQSEIAQQLERERQERVRYQQQLQQLQSQMPQPKAPDMFQEPENWQQHFTNQFQTQLAGQRFQTSEMIARSLPGGNEKVDQAIRWLETNGDPATRARISNSVHPYAEMVKVYDERQTLTQIGGDLESYKKKILEEALKDPTYQAKVIEAARGNPQQRPNNIVQVPPSLNRTGSTGTHTNMPDPGDMSDASLYRQAIS